MLLALNPLFPILRTAAAICHYLWPKATAWLIIAFVVAVQVTPRLVPEPNAPGFLDAMESMPREKMRQAGRIAKEAEAPLIQAHHDGTDEVPVNVETHTDVMVITHDPSFPGFLVDGVLVAALFMSSRRCRAEHGNAKPPTSSGS